MPSQVAGHVEVTGNGEPIDVEGTLTVRFGKALKNEEVMNGAGVVLGYKVTYEAPSMIGTLRVRSDLDVENLVAMSGATIVAKDGAGRKYMLEGAWWSGNPEVEMNANQMPFECKGKTCTVITPS